MAYRIKNWAEFQHYKNRQPPWIKLHRTLLDDLNYAAMSSEAAKYLILIWLVAAETCDGKLPASKKLAFRLRISEDKCVRIIKALSAWIYNDASTVLAGCKQDARPETEEEGEEEGEKETEEETEIEGDVEGDAPPLLTLGEFKNVKMSQGELDNLEAKHGAEKAMKGIDALGAWLKRTGKRRKDHYACLDVASWVWENVAKADAVSGGRKSIGVDFAQIDRDMAAAKKLKGGPR